MHTKTSRQVLSPLADAVTGLIGVVSECEINDTGLPDLSQVALVVDEQIKNLVGIGRKIQEGPSADETFKKEMPLASEAVSKCSKLLLASTTELQKDPKSVSGRNCLLEAVKGILVGTTQVLNVHDDLEVRKIVKSSQQCQSYLNSIIELAAKVPDPAVSQELLRTIARTSQTFVSLAQMTTRRLDELVLELLQARLKVDIGVLTRESPLLISSCKLALSKSSDETKRYSLEHSSRRLIEACHDIEIVVQWREEEQAMPQDHRVLLDSQIQKAQQLNSKLIDATNTEATKVMLFTQQERSNIVDQILERSKDVISQFEPSTVKQQIECIMSNLETCQSRVQRNVNNLLGDPSNELLKQDQCQLLQYETKALESLPSYLNQGLIANLSSSFNQLGDLENPTAIISILNAGVVNSDKPGDRARPDLATVTQAFDAEADKMIHLVSKALNQSGKADYQRVQQIGLYRDRLSSLQSALTEAAQIVADSPSDQAAKTHFGIVCKAWQEGVKELQNLTVVEEGLFQTSDLLAGLNLKRETHAGHIREARRLSSDSGLKSNTLGLLACANQCLSIAKRESDNTEDPQYREQLAANMNKIRRDSSMLDQSMMQPNGSLNYQPLFQWIDNSIDEMQKVEKLIKSNHCIPASAAQSSQNEEIWKIAPPAPPCAENTAKRVKKIVDVGRQLNNAAQSADAAAMTQLSKEYGDLIDSLKEYTQDLMETIFPAGEAREQAETNKYLDNICVANERIQEACRELAASPSTTKAQSEVGQLIPYVDQSLNQLSAHVNQSLVVGLSDSLKSTRLDSGDTNLGALYSIASSGAEIVPRTLEAKKKDFLAESEQLGDKVLMAMDAISSASPKVAQEVARLHARSIGLASVIGKSAQNVAKHCELDKSKKDLKQACEEYHKTCDDIGELLYGNDGAFGEAPLLEGAKTLFGQKLDRVVAALSSGASPESVEAALPESALVAKYYIDHMDKHASRVPDEEQRARLKSQVAAIKRGYEEFVQEAREQAKLSPSQRSSLTKSREALASEVESLSEALYANHPGSAWKRPALSRACEPPPLPVIEEVHTAETQPEPIPVSESISAPEPSASETEAQTAATAEVVQPSKTLENVESFIQEVGTLLALDTPLAAEQLRAKTAELPRLLEEYAAFVQFEKRNALDPIYERQLDLKLGELEKLVPMVTGSALGTLDLGTLKQCIGKITNQLKDIGAIIKNNNPGLATTASGQPSGSQDSGPTLEEIQKEYGDEVVIVDSEAPQLLDEDEAKASPIKAAAQELKVLSSTWTSEENPVIDYSNQLSNLMHNLSQHHHELTRRGGAQAKKEFIETGRAILAAANELCRHAVGLAGHCTDRRLRNQLQSTTDRIQSLSSQLKIVTAVKASAPGDADRDDQLIGCATNLMASVLACLRECESASLRSQGAGMKFRKIYYRRKQFGSSD
ncbi:Vinculin family-domain-containing protein [Polychytrium aggregatum]|uniref:Vinculin family-domain-containing protein n=1 Tax=Polychytrium aggregatum TaxID=110093 RepID=UPI0022FEBAF4|nr:Vinculin family-domain-containing protein [Polychytrium aggregatum]KAI9206152.1 Vinculin family-domain-containing protein [Polychytrium aggregatum]